MEKTAERLYHKDPANNFVFQRSVLAYYEAAKLVSGDVLELGTGQGYGVEVIAQHTDKFTTLDKFKPDDHVLALDHVDFIQTTFPPIQPIKDDSIDYVITFQVIEHIEDDHLFLKEIHRVLKPGGQLIMTTPNKTMSLTRNPWHVREYTIEELRQLTLKYFDKVDARGVFGNDKITQYYAQNKASVRRITRWDIFNLQYRLPRSWLQYPYDVLNKRNRTKLLEENTSLVSDIIMEDYHIAPAAEGCYDLFYVATKG